MKGLSPRVLSRTCSPLVNSMLSYTLSAPQKSMRRSPRLDGAAPRRRSVGSSFARTASHITSSDLPLRASARVPPPSAAVGRSGGPCGRSRAAPPPRRTVAGLQVAGADLLVAARVHLQLDALVVAPQENVPHLDREDRVAVLHRARQHGRRRCGWLYAPVADAAQAESPSRPSPCRRACGVAGPACGPRSGSPRHCAARRALFQAALGGGPRENGPPTPAQRAHRVVRAAGGRRCVGRERHWRNTVPRRYLVRSSSRNGAASDQFDVRLTVGISRVSR